jgi:hypothetical protein
VLWIARRWAQPVLGVERAGTLIDRVHQWVRLISPSVTLSSHRQVGARVEAVLQIGDQPREGVAARVRPEQYAQPARAELEPALVTNTKIDGIGLPLPGDDFAGDRPQPERLLAREQVRDQRVEIGDLVGKGRAWRRSER